MLITCPFRFSNNNFHSAAEAAERTDPVIKHRTVFCKDAWSIHPHPRVNYHSTLSSAVGLRPVAINPRRPSQQKRNQPESQIPNSCSPFLDKPHPTCICFRSFHAISSAARPHGRYEDTLVKFP
ncbi:unnamed protein product [Chondrus crispus]|uniref:Uncharacterized protein n=1 Tax=Chondrus crispus TaxID=2769 RepID=R7QFH3_CHOCR|nr:unnamed protein product [Chondrus crispus]CDF36478.1 unnamed protein product [Chondrus crispus]|eukprot:XP_005716297.1 unnamed protein product [Chondrus crispus]